jgi:glycosidase
MMENHPNDKDLHAITRREITKKSRDNARTPMQWSSSPHGGFSTTTPWQEVNPSYSIINAASQTSSPDSVFSYWSQILKLRKEWKDIFIYGDFKLVDEGNEDVFAYTRSFGKEKVLVVANFRERNVGWSIPAGLEIIVDREVLIGNYERGKGDGEGLELRPFEAFAVFVKQTENA